MTCKRIDDKLDDYIDGTLDERAAAALDRHVDSCDSCRQTVAGERRLRGLLEAYPAPRPDDAYFDRALARATHVGNSRQRNRWIMTGFGGAVAAAIVAWLIGGMLLERPAVTDPAATIPGITMALEEPRTVNLVFSSATELRDATLTVTLPQGIEIEGFAGQREITWMTNLQAGKNVLPLRLIAMTAHGGEVFARLEHDDRDRTFRIRVTVS